MSIVASQYPGAPRSLILGGQPECSRWEQGNQQGARRVEKDWALWVMETSAQEQRQERTNVLNFRETPTPVTNLKPSLMERAEQAGKAELYPEQSGDGLRTVSGQLLSFSKPGRTPADAKSPGVRSAWQIPNCNASYRKGTPKNNFFLLISVLRDPEGKNKITIAKLLATDHSRARLERRRVLGFRKLFFSSQKS